MTVKAGARRSSCSTPGTRSTRRTSTRRDPWLRHGTIGVSILIYHMGAPQARVEIGAAEQAQVIATEIAGMAERPEWMRGGTEPRWRKGCANEDLEEDV